MKRNLLMAAVIPILVLALLPMISSAQMEYKEAPILAEMVKAGKLPPVEQRLPKEPLVIEPVEEIGQYGGTWNQLIASVSETKLITVYSYDKLLRWDPKAQKIIPNVAKSWEVSEGGKVFTFHLREGMKWSDGHPFTADDVLFWYEDILLNEELTPTFPTWLTVGGEPVKIEKIDDYTVSFRFVKPYGLLLEYLAYFHEPFRPKHYLKNFHPNYVDKKKLDAMAKEEGFEFWYQLFGQKDTWYSNQNPDCPTIKPWVATVKPPATRFVFERNPYYWKVDTAGNQLPYIDRVALNLMESAEVVNIKTMAGEADMQSRRITFANYTLFMKNREKGGYRVLTWPRDLGSQIALFPNQNIKDPVLRGVIQDPRFRKALSLAINRDEINELVYLGVGVPRQATVISTSPLFEEEYARAYADYDPERANRLLDEMGLTKRDAEGFRLRPDGKTLSLLINTAGEQAEETDVLEIVKEDWEAIGIKTAYKPLERALLRNRITAGEVEVATWGLDRSHYPFEPTWYVPIGEHTYWAPLYGLWYSSGGKSGEEPKGDIRKLQEIWDEIKITVDPGKRNKLFQDILDLHAKNIWIIGLVGETPQLVIVKNNFRNVPEKSLFSWSTGQYYGLARAEQFFIKR